MLDVLYRPLYVVSPKGSVFLCRVVTLCYEQGATTPHNKGRVLRLPCCSCSLNIFLWSICSDFTLPTL